MRINTGDNTNDENIYLKTDNNTNLSNLNLNNILKGHDEIRDYIQQLKDIISILIKNNTELNYSNQNLALSISNIEDNNISLNKQNDENEKNDNLISNAFSYQKPISQFNTFKNVKLKTPQEKKTNKLQIKIINSMLKKDEYGRPYLDYICEVKYNDKEWKILKKFNQFALLHNAIKNLFKDTFQLPKTGSLFTNINDMTGNAFHENKINQLDKYINELIEIDEVSNSVPFKNFFELDEEHIQNDKIKNKAYSLGKETFNNLSDSKIRKQQISNPRKFNVPIPKKK